ncbi:MAG: SRPBCC domain-containing protein [Deltaproteobacteria bacterium]|nr:MAG: SRPBCC domain-containing protein [Deltaproteobacteria bacterium]
MIALLSVAFAGGFTPRVEEVDIDAPPEVVWGVMTDLLAYEAWNPWLVEAEGSMEEGRTVTAEVRLNGKTRTARHRVIEVVPHERFCWQDMGWFTLFARGQRCRTFTATESGGTHLRVELVVHGPASGTVEKQYGDSLSEGLAAETQALAARAVRLRQVRR